MSDNEEIIQSVIENIKYVSELEDRISIYKMISRHDNKSFTYSSSGAYVNLDKLPEHINKQIYDFIQRKLNSQNKHGL